MFGIVNLTKLLKVQPDKESRNGKHKENPELSNCKNRKIGIISQAGKQTVLEDYDREKSYHKKLWKYHRIS